MWFFFRRKKAVPERPQKADRRAAAGARNPVSGQARKPARRPEAEPYQQRLAAARHIARAHPKPVVDLLRQWLQESAPAGLPESARQKRLYRRPGKK